MGKKIPGDAAKRQFKVEDYKGKHVVVETVQTVRRVTRGLCVDISEAGVVIEYEARGRLVRRLRPYMHITGMTYISDAGAQVVEAAHA